MNPEPPGPSEHLRTVRHRPGRIRWMIVSGILLILAALVLNFATHSALAFLAYPILILGAIGALATGASFIIRHF